MSYLVLGGAGYIGSHMVEFLLEKNENVVVVDNLSTGHRESVSSSVEFVELDILETDKLTEIINSYNVSHVLHFAANSLVAESVSDPSKYYANNILGTKSVLEAIRAARTQPYFIFSSSCAIYGIPEKLPINEDDPKDPISPYGRTKLSCEWLIEDYANAYGLKAIALRYFNACGASASGKIGEDHNPESHLIPNAIKACLSGGEMKLFGDDYQTKDGSCIRDYIHVDDLAEFHYAAAKRLSTQEGASFEAYLLGTGIGLTNKEILESVEKYCEKPLSYRVESRRSGDPERLLCNPALAESVLGVSASRSGLENIIRSAAKFHINYPNGYQQ